MTDGEAHTKHDAIADLFPPLSRADGSHDSSAPFFARSSILALWSAALDLIKANEAETGYHHDNVEPEDYAEHYFDLEERGFTRFFTMFHDGKLTGYQVFVIGPHFRHRGRLWASQDAFYVAPEHRGIEVSHFMTFADGELKREGYRRLRNFRPEHDLSKLYAHHGYEKLEEIWVSED